MVIGLEIVRKIVDAIQHLSQREIGSVLKKRNAFFNYQLFQQEMNSKKSVLTFLYTVLLIKRKRTK